MTRADASSRMGPSLELDKSAFVQRYGTERELLAEVNSTVSHQHEWLRPDRGTIECASCGATRLDREHIP